MEEGLVVEGFPIEVYNVLGAGDAFMSGFLSGYLREAPLAEACRLANACGALVVSRHGCAPASPTRIELQHFLKHGILSQAIGGWRIGAVQRYASGTPIAFSGAFGFPIYRQPALYYDL